VYSPLATLLFALAANTGAGVVWMLRCARAAHDLEPLP